MSIKIISLEGHCHLGWVYELMDTNRSWNISLARHHFLLDDEEILKMRISPCNLNDFIDRIGETSRTFTIRSDYQLAFEEIHLLNQFSCNCAPDGNRRDWMIMWECATPAKVCIFAWRVAKNSLTTWYLKHSKNMEPTDLCTLYRVECSLPALYMWKSTRALWQVMDDLWSLPNPNEMKNTCPKWLIHIACDMPEN